MSFAFYRPVTIDHTKVGGSDLTNYPVGFIGVYAWCATVANGGRAQNANGYDAAIPHTTSGLTTALDYELVTYNATTGAIERYFRQATLSSAVDDVVYMAIGDASITTNGSSTATWDSNFKAVYHLGNASTLWLNDSTSNARTLTNNNGVTAVAGPIANVGGAGGFASASSQWLGNTAGGAPVSTAPGTITSLVYSTDFAANQKIISIGSTSANSVQFDTGPRTTSQIRVTHNNAQAFTGTYSTATWVHSGARFVSTTDRWAYLNGTGTQDTALATNVTPGQVAIGAQKTNAAAALFMNGRIDEVRISDIDRGAGWMTAEYNNLLSPSTFYSVGSEVAVGGGGTIASAIGAAISHAVALAQGVATAAEAARSLAASVAFAVGIAIGAGDGRAAGPSTTLGAAVAIGAGSGASASPSTGSGVGRSRHEASGASVSASVATGSNNNVAQGDGFSVDDSRAVAIPASTAAGDGRATSPSRVVGAPASMAAGDGRSISATIVLGSNSQIAQGDGFAVALALALAVAAPVGSGDGRSVSHAIARAGDAAIAGGAGRASSDARAAAIGAATQAAIGIAKSLAFAAAIGVDANVVLIIIPPSWFDPDAIETTFSADAIETSFTPDIS